MKPLRSLALVCLLATVVPAVARQPDPEQKPTLDALEADARARKLAAEKAAAEAARDPIQEAIDAFRDQVSPLEQWERIVELVKADEGEEAAYRQAAKDALIARFQADGEKDVKVLKARRAAALELCDLMKAKSDPDGRMLVQEILQKWFRTYLIRSGYKPNDSARKRIRAYRKMTDYLEGE